MLDSDSDQLVLKLTNRSQLLLICKKMSLHTGRWGRKGRKRKKTKADLSPWISSSHWFHELDIWFRGLSETFVEHFAEDQNFCRQFGLSGYPSVRTDNQKQ
ncbi:hypothetical protein V6N13_136567 [Hibiscus sabdariffa]|uniref:Uncharacterized protein n=1 Tax=Hibiscus sabdariffa TaxID=183260 RepID=A0ABR2DN70_9ROSI